MTGVTNSSTAAEVFVKRTGNKMNVTGKTVDQINLEKRKQTGNVKTIWGGGTRTVKMSSIRLESKTGSSKNSKLMKEAAEENTFNPGFI